VREKRRTTLTLKSNIFRAIIRRLPSKGLEIGSTTSMLYRAKLKLSMRSGQMISRI
jgi:hypothetical protein